MQFTSRIKKAAESLIGRKSVKEGETMQDDFINWLRFANAGMINNGNISSLDYAIKNLKSNKPIIEIGSFCGLSTNVIVFFMRKYSRSNSLFTCDRWEFEGARDLVPGVITTAGYRDFVKQSYIRNVSFFSQGKLPYTIEKFSDDFFESWATNKVESDVMQRPVQMGGPISFAYIDGNHSYDFSKRDFENVDKFLEVGGFILFDDSGDGSQWEVCKVIEELKQNPQYKVIQHNPNYLVEKIA